MADELEVEEDAQVYEKQGVQISVCANVTSSRMMIWLTGVSRADLTVPELGMPIVSLAAFPEKPTSTHMAESHLLRDMRDAIAGVLPDLPDEVVKSVEETLKALGATTSDDLKYIKENDLLPVLKPIQARRLVAAWTQNASSISTPTTGHSSPVRLLSSPSTSSSPGSSTITSSPSGLQTSLIPDWVERFEIPWERFPEELMQNLERQKRPSARQRREMVRIVVSEMMKLCRNPTKQNTTEIAKRMVTKYPKSFQDVIDGDVIGPGYHSLVKQLQSRVENVKRPDTPKVVKRKAASDHDDDTDEIPAEQKASVQDTYGIDLVKELVKCTYYTQRKDINKGASIQKLCEEWPFLFNEVGMAEHFQELTGVNLIETFLANVDKKGARLLKFLRYVDAQKRKQVLDALLKLQTEKGQSNRCSQEVNEMLLLLLAHFGEKEQLLFRCVEMTSQAEDVEMDDVPPTPFIIVCGSSCFSAETFMLSIDKNIVNDKISSFTSAICLMFGSYFCLIYTTLWNFVQHWSFSK
ncbi:hypothetical protein FQA47_007296, partial [Oryzias melastigma]